MIIHYEKANKAALKDYNQKMHKGDYPYIPVLDHATRFVPVKREVYMGLLDIPLELVVGTVTAARANSFASNFMPLLDKASEFADKWEAVSRWHLQEGINDPIKVYEFMDRFYVLEGNKRVSVLKYFDAVSVPANVYRVVPEYNAEDKAIRTYYEFMHFYDLCGLNVISFSEEGSYKEFVRLLGYSDSERWSEDEILAVRSLYNRFQLALDDLKKKKLPVSTSDALLRLLKLYEYGTLYEDSVTQLKERILHVWDELTVLQEEEAVELKLDPVDTEAGPGPVKQVMQILSPGKNRHKIGFVHDKNPQTSGWTNAHEMGRTHMASVYPELAMESYMDALADGSGETAIRKAITEGCDIIFTTSPKLLEASVKLAVEFPQVHILNCSLNTSYKSVRTYYGRLYEAKFLAGLLAGAMSPDGRIGYVADYPLQGMIANINAFALGVQMVNPRARVKLLWSHLQNGPDFNKELETLSVISQKEMIGVAQSSKDFGLCLIEDGEKKSLAVPIWKWGTYYVKIYENICNGLWKTEEDRRALNYWWGLSAGVVDILMDVNLPAGVKKLTEQIMRNIKHGDLIPFSGILKTADGVMITHDDYTVIEPKEIVAMDWLLENVEGRIPSMSELTEDAKALVRLQGVAGVEDEDTDHRG